MLIAATDRVRLPDGVVLSEDGLVDPVRDAVFSINPSARLILAHADGRTVAEIAGRLGAPSEITVRAILDFCTQQNERLLLNVELTRGAATRWLAAAARTAPFGLLPPFPRRRVALPGAVAWRALLDVGAAAGALAAAAAFAVLAAGGVIAPIGALVLGACVGAGLVLHEGAHAVALTGVPCCLALAGLRVAVVHRPLPPGRRRAVAVAGPAAAALAGGLALGAAWLWSFEEAAIGAAPLASHALGLTVLAGDGRAACGLS